MRPGRTARRFGYKHLFSYVLKSAKGQSQNTCFLGTAADAKARELLEPGVPGQPGLHSKTPSPGRIEEGREGKRKDKE